MPSKIYEEYRMNKISVASIFSFAFFFVSSAVVLLTEFIPFVSPWIPLAIGIVLMIFAGSYEFISSGSIVLNIVCSLVNAVALGFCIRAWYIYREIDNGILTMLLLSLACTLYLLLFCLPLCIPFVEKHIKVYFGIFVIMSVVLYLIPLFTTRTSYLSTFGFYWIIDILLIAAMCRDSVSFRSFIRKMTLATSGTAFVAVIIAVLMLDGDLDFLELGDGIFDIESPRKKKLKTKNNTI